MLLMARYVLPVSRHYIEDGAVLVRDDKVVEVGPAQDLKARYPEEEVRDFGMAAIMPGFVDCHSHLEYSIMRGLLNERNIKMRPSNGDRIPIIPIYTYEPIPTLTIAKELYDRGVYVNSSLPPAAAPHECLLRTSLMATHTHALIDEAVTVIAEVLRGYDL